MKILTHGKYINLYKCFCAECECTFICSENELDKHSSGFSSWKQVSCPECNHTLDSDTDLIKLIDNEEATLYM